MRRARAVRKLAKVAPPEEALPHLIEASQDTDPDVREAAMFVLDKLALDTSAHLAAGLDDEDGWVRLRAAAGLAHRGDGRGRAVLQSLAASDDYDACVLALDGLGDLRDEAALLAVMLDPASGPAVREAVLRSLRPSESDQARRIRAAALDDESRFVRRAMRDATGDVDVSE